MEVLFALTAGTRQVIGYIGLVCSLWFFEKVWFAVRQKKMSAAAMYGLIGAVVVAGSWNFADQAIKDKWEQRQGENEYELREYQDRATRLLESIEGQWRQVPLAAAAQVGLPVSEVPAEEVARAQRLMRSQPLTLRIRKQPKTDENYGLWGDIEFERGTIASGRFTAKNTYYLDHYFPLEDKKGRGVVYFDLESGNGQGRLYETTSELRDAGAMLEWPSYAAACFESRDRSTLLLILGNAIRGTSTSRDLSTPERFNEFKAQMEWKTGLAFQRQP